MIPLLLATFSTCLALNFEPDLRIIGGRSVALGEVPHQVSLQTEKSGHICGGALLSMEIVLTAAHCIHKKKLEDIKVVAGAVDLTDESGDTRQESVVDRGMVNPNFDEYSSKYDLAVLKLKVPFALTMYVQAIQLPVPDYSAQGYGEVTGWGATQEGMPNTNLLMGAMIRIYTADECRYYYGDDVDENILCGGSRLGYDACNGDSGGPLVCKHKTKVLCGIISAGIGCGHEDTPGIYTNVGSFTNWILFIISQL